MGHAAAFPLRVSSLLLAVALLLTARLAAAQTACVAGKEVALSLRLHTNATGHRQVNARLEQPTRSTSWQLDIELGIPGCITGPEELRVLTLSLTESPLVPPGYFPVTGLGIIRPSKDFLEWEVANATCTAEGATLLMPASTQQARALSDVLNFGVNEPRSAKWAWLGATDYAQEGTWVSVTGETLTQGGKLRRHTWSPETPEPNGGRTENCLVVFRDTGLVGDAPCNWKLAYACQLQL